VDQGRAWPPGFAGTGRSRTSSIGRRDVTYQEDKSLVRIGNVPRVTASLRSLAISLLRLNGHANMAAANRHHARDPQRTLNCFKPHE
jgi:hypothetical protein